MSTITGLTSSAELPPLSRFDPTRAFLLTSSRARGPADTFYARSKQEGGPDFVGVAGPSRVLELGTNGEGAVVAKGPGGTLYPVPDTVAAQGRDAIRGYLSNKYQNGGINDVYVRDGGATSSQSPSQAQGLRDQGWSLYREGMGVVASFDRGGLTATDLQGIRSRIQAYSESFAHGKPAGTEEVYAAVVSAPQGASPSLLQQIDSRLGTAGSSGERTRPSPAPFTENLGVRFGRPITQSFEVDNQGRGAYALRLGDAPAPFFTSGRPINLIDVQRGPGKAALEAEGRRQGAGEPTPVRPAPTGPANPAPNNPVEGALQSLLHDPDVRVRASTAGNVVGMGTSFEFGGRKVLAYLLVPTKVLLDSGPLEAAKQGTLFLSVSNPDGTSTVAKLNVSQQSWKFGKGAALPLLGGGAAAFANLTAGVTTPLTGPRPVAGSLDFSYGILLKASAVPVLGTAVQGLAGSLDRAGNALILDAVQIATASLAADATGVGLPAGLAGLGAAGMTGMAGTALKLLAQGVNNAGVAVGSAVQVNGLTLTDAGVISVNGSKASTSDVVRAVVPGALDLVEKARRIDVPRLGP